MFGLVNIIQLVFTFLESIEKELSYYILIKYYRGHFFFGIIDTKD